MTENGSFLAHVCIAITTTTTRHTHKHVGQSREERGGSRIERTVTSLMQRLWFLWLVLVFLSLSLSWRWHSLLSCFLRLFFPSFLPLLFSFRFVLCTATERKVSPPAAVLCVLYCILPLYRAHTSTSSVACSAIKMAEPKLWSLSPPPPPLLPPPLSPSLPSSLPSFFSSVLEPTVGCKQCCAVSLAV